MVKAAVSEATFRQVAQKMQKTLGIKLTGDPVKAVEVLANRYTLNETERVGVAASWLHRFLFGARASPIEPGLEFSRDTSSLMMLGKRIEAIAAVFE